MKKKREKKLNDYEHFITSLWSMEHRCKASKFVDQILRGYFIVHKLIIIIIIFLAKTAGNEGQKSKNITTY